ADHVLPPRLLHVPLQFHPERAVVPEPVDAAVDLRGLVDEPHVLAELGELRHVDLRRHRRTLPRSPWPGPRHSESVLGCSPLRPVVPGLAKTSATPPPHPTPPITVGRVESSRPDTGHRHNGGAQVVGVGPRRRLLDPTYKARNSARNPTREAGRMVLHYGR